MTRFFYTLLLAGVAISPITAYAQNLAAQTTVTQTQINQNLTQPELNAIKGGELTDKGQPIPVETQILMSTGNLDGYTVRKVQQSLTERGYYKGPISGNWDSGTSTSLQSFQQASGEKIDPSGTLIASGTLARLGVTMDKLTAGDANSHVARAPDQRLENHRFASQSTSTPGRVVDQPKILGQITIPASQHAAYAPATPTTTPAVTGPTITTVTTVANPVMPPANSAMQSIRTTDTTSVRVNRPGLLDSPTLPAEHSGM